MTTPTTARHHCDGADLRTGDARPVMGERIRHIGAGATVTGLLKHHVHEPRAPQAAAAGRITADIAACLGYEARSGTEAAAARGAMGHAAVIRVSGHPTATPRGDSTAGARDHPTAIAGNHSCVAPHGHSTAAAHSHSTAAAHGHSTAAAHGDATAAAHGDAADIGVRVIAGEGVAEAARLQLRRAALEARAACMPVMMMSAGVMRVSVALCVMTMRSC